LPQMGPPPTQIDLIDGHRWRSGVENACLNGGAAETSEINAIQSEPSRNVVALTDRGRQFVRVLKGAKFIEIRVGRGTGR
jgi:hypothetical protein